MGVAIHCVDRHLVVGGNSGGAQLGRGLIDVVDEETDCPTVAALGARAVRGADREGRAVARPIRRSFVWLFSSCERRFVSARAPSSPPGGWAA
jgi:hypothetical protein